MPCLQHAVRDGSDDDSHVLAMGIRQQLDEGCEPKDIAVLCRSNYEVPVQMQMTCLISLNSALPCQP